MFFLLHRYIYLYLCLPACVYSCICIYLICICMYLYINMCRMTCTKSRTRHAETIYKIPYIYNLHQRKLDYLCYIMK